MFPRPDRIIVPQYEPTPGLSLVAAAELLGESRRAVAAQLVDLAVRGVVAVSRQKRGFVLERLVSGGGLGCNEFVFRRAAS